MTRLRNFHIIMRVPLDMHNMLLKIRGDSSRGVARLNLGWAREEYFLIFLIFIPLYSLKFSSFSYSIWPSR